MEGKVTKVTWDLEDPKANVAFLGYQDCKVWLENLVHEDHRENEDLREFKAHQVNQEYLRVTGKIS